MDLGVLLGIVGIVIGLVSLALALPSFMQMIWGSPRLEIVYEGGRHDSNKNTLLCVVKNKPITNLILKALGIHRDPTDITAKFYLYQQGTNNLIGDVTHVVFLKTRRNVNPSLYFHLTVDDWAIFTIIQEINGVINVTRRQDLDSEQTLLFGRYKFVICISLASRNRDIRFEREFVAGTAGKELRWLPDNRGE